MFYNEGGVRLKNTKRLICTCLFLFALIIPASASANSGQYQTNSQHGFFQDICDFFSWGNDNHNNDYNQFGDQDKNHGDKDYDNHDNDKENCWEWIWNWWCGGGDDHHHDGDDDDHHGGDKCDENHHNFNNDDGCTTSADIWKKWFCH